MELKIGDIKQVDGEWYQCCELGKLDLQCDNCDLVAKDCHSKIGHCFYEYRHDNKNVVFKKLEKIGKPFERNGYMYQEYKTHRYPLLMSGDAKIPTDNGFAVIIKQNKEYMKTVKISKDDLNFLVNKIRYGILQKHIDKDKITNEISKLFSIDNIEDSNTENIGKNLKPFDLQAAKSGKPVCTRDGRKVRIICFDQKDIAQIVGLVTGLDGKESIYAFYKDGRVSSQEERVDDLMMLPEKKEGWVNVYYDNDASSHRGCRYIYDTKEQAIKSAGEGYITTVKIPWEE